MNHVKSKSLIFFYICNLTHSRLVSVRYWVFLAFNALILNDVNGVIIEIFFQIIAFKNNNLIYTIIYS